MIISHKYKYIFIKTAKTAGTSIEIALSRYCGRGDVITRCGPLDEITRREFGGRSPQNYWTPFSAYRRKDIRRFLREGKRRRWYYNHIPARLIKDRVGEHIWRNYFKFCFERNPFDRMISYYYFYYRKQTQPEVSLEDFIASDAPDRLHRSGFGLFSVDGVVAVDRVCLYEDLEAELEDVRLLLVMPEPLELPHAKSGTRTDRRDYRDVLSDEEMEKIAEICRPEMELCRYER